MIEVGLRGAFRDHQAVLDPPGELEAALSSTAIMQALSNVAPSRARELVRRLDRPQRDPKASRRSGARDR
jgi:hypothetical protein